MDPPTQRSPPPRPPPGPPPKPENPAGARSAPTATPAAAALPGGRPPGPPPGPPSGQGPPRPAKPPPPSSPPPPAATTSPPRPAPPPPQKPAPPPSPPAAAASAAAPAKTPVGPPPSGQALPFKPPPPAVKAVPPPAKPEPPPALPTALGVAPASPPPRAAAPKPPPPAPKPPAGVPADKPPPPLEEAPGVATAAPKQATQRATPVVALVEPPAAAAPAATKGGVSNAVVATGGGGGGGSGTISAESAAISASVASRSASTSPVRKPPPGAPPGRPPASPPPPGARPQPLQPQQQLGRSPSPPGGRPPPPASPPPPRPAPAAAAGKVPVLASVAPEGEGPAATGAGAPVVAVDDPVASAGGKDSAEQRQAMEEIVPAAAAAQASVPTTKAATTPREKPVTARIPVASKVASSAVTPRAGGAAGAAAPAALANLLLKPGRLTVECLAARNVVARSLPGASRTPDIYLKLALARASELPSKKTVTQRKAAKEVNLGGEELRFDILAPQALLGGDAAPGGGSKSGGSGSGGGGDVVLFVELWEDTSWNDELLGSAEMSVLRWLSGDDGGGGGGKSSAEDADPPWLALRRDVSGSLTPAGEVQLRVRFEEASIGMAVVTLRQGRGLGDAIVAPRPRAYVRLGLGEAYRKRGATAYEGGRDPSFNDEEIVLWADAANWVHDLRVECLSEDIAADAILGEATLPLLPYMAPRRRLQAAAGGDIEVSLRLEGQDRGTLTLGISFLRAGKLTVQCVAARGLKGGAAAGTGRLDPYLLIKAEGAAVAATRKTKVHKDGGAAPSWKETLALDIVDQYLLAVECYHHDLLDKDRLLGAARQSLLPVFQRGRWEGWVALEAPGKYGAAVPAGEAHLIMEFDGPHGVAYPQRQPGVDAFDHSQRQGLQAHLTPQQQAAAATASASSMAAPANTPAAAMATAAPVSGAAPPGDAIVVAAEGAAVAQAGPEAAGEDALVAAAAAAAAEEAGEAEQNEDAPPLPPPDFSEDEVENAFRFLDLDHNSFLGAAEIRHILVCMGERITDEEVDMMISMVDRDGDGQVSFAEFRALVLDPDPARVDFGVAGGVPPVGANAAGWAEADAAAAAREAAAQQQERMDRDAKRWLAEEFVRENEVGMAELQLAVERMRRLPAAQRAGGLLDFETWVEAMRVEPTGQYRKLFKLYGSPDAAVDGPPKLDMKEFLLGLANFVDVDRDKRAHFIFDLFDEDRSGFLSMAELLDVLKANHMATAAAVKNKALTIMRQADTDGSGTLSLEEFIVVGKRFPNILYPPRKRADAAGGGGNGGGGGPEADAMMLE